MQKFGNVLFEGSVATVVAMRAGLPKFQAIESGACRIKLWACQDTYRQFGDGTTIHAHTVDVCAEQCAKTAGCKGATWQEEHVSGQDNCFLCTWNDTLARVPQPCRPERGAPHVDYLVMAQDCAALPFEAEPLDECEVNPWPLPAPGAGADYPPGPPGTYPIQTGEYSSGRGSVPVPALPAPPAGPAAGATTAPATTAPAAPSNTAGAATAPAAPKDDGGSDSATVAIVVSVVGGIVLIALIAALSICFVVKKRRAHEAENAKAAQYGSAMHPGSQYPDSMYGPRSQADGSLAGTWQVCTP